MPAQQQKISSFFSSGIKRPLLSSLQTNQQHVHVVQPQKKKKRAKATECVQIIKLTNKVCFHLPYALGTRLLTLSLEDLNSACQVCKQWKNVGKNNAFWKRPVYKRFPLFFDMNILKIRPMGIYRHLYHSPPLQWGNELPQVGAYIWCFHFAPLSVSHERLQKLMGVSKPYFEVGVEAKKVVSARGNSNSLMNAKKKVLKNCSIRYEGLEGIIYLIIDCNIRQFTIMSKPPEKDENFQVQPWKSIEDSPSLFPYCKAISCSLQVTIIDVKGSKRNEIHRCS